MKTKSRKKKQRAKVKRNLNRKLKRNLRKKIKMNLRKKANENLNKNRIRETDQDGTVHEYDTDGKLIKLTYPDGTEYEYKYDAAGKLVKATRSDGRIYRYEQDANGNPTKATCSDGTIHEWDAAHGVALGNPERCQPAVDVRVRVDGPGDDRAAGAVECVRRLARPERDDPPVLGNEDVSVRVGTPDRHAGSLT